MKKCTTFLFLFYIIFFISYSYSSQCSSSSKKGSNGDTNQARLDDKSHEEGPCMIAHNTPLARLDGVKVGRRDWNIWTKIVYFNHYISQRKNLLLSRLIIWQFDRSTIMNQFCLHFAFARFVLDFIACDSIIGVCLVFLNGILHRTFYR